MPGRSVFMPQIQQGIYKGIHMNKVSGKEACQLAINLIEEQLRVLPISIAMILHSTKAGDVEPDTVANSMQLQRKRRPLETGSSRKAVSDNAQADSVLDFHASNQVLHENPLCKMSYLRVVISNALLAVGVFLKEHDMSTSRTPQMQFLGHIRNAIINANTFDIDPGYIPAASFAGLVIDGTLNGSLLFGDGVTEGFMGFGDAVALLQWLSRYLSAEKDLVTGGDAG